MVIVSERKEVVTELKYDERVHYTSVNALYSILKNEEIWLTHSDFLNDSTELIHFDELLKKFLNEFKQKSDFNNMAFASEVERAIYEDNCYEHFIFSLSYDPDSLSLWNYYGKKDGYNLIFNKSLWRNFCNYLKDLNNNNGKEKAKLYLGEVVYEEKLKKKIIKRRLNKLYEFWNELDTTKYLHMREFQITAEVFLKGLRMYFKNKAYSQEKEIRFVLSLPEHIVNEKLEFRTLEGGLLPYIKVPLPNNIISNITIGPKISIDIAEKGLKRFLKHLKYLRSHELEIKLKKSSIPVRY